MGFNWNSSFLPKCCWVYRHSCRVTAATSSTRWEEMNRGANTQTLTSDWILRSLESLFLSNKRLCVRQRSQKTLRAASTPNGPKTDVNKRSGTSRTMILTRVIVMWSFGQTAKNPSARLTTRERAYKTIQRRNAREGNCVAFLAQWSPVVLQQVAVLQDNIFWGERTRTIQTADTKRASCSSACAAARDSTCSVSRIITNQRRARTRTAGRSPHPHTNPREAAAINSNGRLLNGGSLSGARPCLDDATKSASCLLICLSDERWFASH